MKRLINPMIFTPEYCRRAFVAIGLLGGLASLAACGPAEIPTGINDPHEMQNRRTHEWNKEFDRRTFGDDETLNGDGSVAAAPADEVVRPVSPIIVALANFGTNLDNPRRVLNSLLQVRPGDAMHNTMRFAVNSTIGIGGLIDVAGAGGLPEIDTNFSETMHVWGVPEGAFQELPVVGPSTQRDTAGAVVDFAINPLWYAFSWPGNLAANTAVWVGEATDRVRYADTVSSLYHDSEDSYALSRQVYLQNRRFELRRGEVAEEDYADPYEELYGD